jgi:hypothetical protein
LPFSHRHDATEAKPAHPHMDHLAASVGLTFENSVQQKFAEFVF